MKTEKTTITFRIDNDLREKAQKIAKSETRTLTSLISYALKVYLEGKK